MILRDHSIIEIIAAFIAASFNVMTKCAHFKYRRRSNKGPGVKRCQELAKGFLEPLYIISSLIS